MVKGYSRYKVKICWLHYHFVWYTWKNRPLLDEFMINECKKLIESKLKELKCELRLFEGYSNHIYLAIKSNPLLSPNQIINQLRGTTSRYLREKHPLLLKKPSLWNRSYFVSSFGRHPSREIKEYERYMDKETKKYQRLVKKRNKNAYKKRMNENEED